jgi:hypothetical protein
MPDRNLDIRNKRALDIVHDSGLVNLDHLGDVVKQVVPGLKDTGIAADDYVAKAYTSVVQVWKTGLTMPGLENVAQLTQVGKQIRNG